MATGHTAGRSLKGNTISSQNFAGRQRLLMGNDAVVHIEHYLCRPLSDPVSEPNGFRLCIYCRRQHLHVRVWRTEIVLVVSIWYGEICDVCPRCGVYDSGQYCH